MNAIERYLDGSLDVTDFVYLLNNNNLLQNEVRFLLPEKVKNDKSDPFWNNNLYSSYKEVNFDTFELLKRLCHFDNSFGDNVNLYYYLLDVYKINHPDISFVGLFFASVYYRIKNADTPTWLDYGIWIITVILVTPIIIIERNKKKKASQYPYFICITPMSFDVLIEEISRSTKLHKIERGWYYYGDARFGSKVMCIFSNMYQYSEDSLASLQDNLYEQAWEDCGLKKRISMADAKNLIIIFINTVDSDNDALQKVIYKKAASTSSTFGNVFDAYVVLSDGVVYIPRCTSTEFFEEAQFNNAVKYLCDLFEDLEDVS